MMMVVELIPIYIKENGKEPKIEEMETTINVKSLYLLLMIWMIIIKEL